MLAKFDIQIIRHRLTETSFRDSGPANIYIFAGWEVRMVKNCDRGLENAALGANKEQWQVALTDSVAQCYLHPADLTAFTLAIVKTIFFDPSLNS